MSRLHRRQRRDHRGQALVEFALIVSLFVLVVVGLFDAGRAVYTYNALSNASREAVREAIVHQNDAAIEARADNILGGLAPAVTFTHDKSDCAPTVEAGCLYGVELSYQFVPVTPGLGSIFRPILSAGAEMPVEHINPNP